MDAERSSGAQWHQRTLERSLRSARARAISRGDKFITAAAELLRETGRPEFTVQEVVDRSGMSLRSFYHHFATKDDLLLALIEETVIAYMRRLQPLLDAEEDPLERLRIFIRFVYGGEDKDDPAARGMVLFHWQLADSRSEEFVACLGPQVEVLERLLSEGVAAGKVRDDVPVPVLTAFITHSLMSMLDMRVMGVSITDGPLSGDEVWACMQGLVAPQARPK